MNWFCLQEQLLLANKHLAITQLNLEYFKNHVGFRNPNERLVRRPPMLLGRGAAGLLPGGEAQPAEFAGARVVETGGFPCPGYGTVTLSLGLSPRIWNEVR